MEMDLRPWPHFWRGLPSRRALSGLLVKVLDLGTAECSLPAALADEEDTIFSHGWTDAGRRRSGSRAAVGLHNNGGSSNNTAAACTPTQGETAAGALDASSRSSPNGLTNDEVLQHLHAIKADLEQQNARLEQELESDRARLGQLTRADEAASMLSLEMEKLMAAKRELIQERSRLESDVHLLWVERVLLCKQLDVPSEESNLVAVMADKLVRTERTAEREMGLRLQMLALKEDCAQLKEQLEVLEERVAADKTAWMDQKAQLKQASIMLQSALQQLQQPPVAVPSSSAALRAIQETSEMLHAMSRRISATTCSDSEDEQHGSGGDGTMDPFISLLQLRRLTNQISWRSSSGAAEDLLPHDSDTDERLQAGPGGGGGAAVLSFGALPALPEMDAATPEGAFQAGGVLPPAVPSALRLHLYDAMDAMDDTSRAPDSRTSAGLLLHKLPSSAALAAAAQCCDAACR